MAPLTAHKVCLSLSGGSDKPLGGRTGVGQLPTCLNHRRIT